MRQQILLIPIIILLFQIGIKAQPHAFAKTEITKTKAYKGEAIELKITAFTSTWFTKGVNPGNIKIEGAFTIYFRSLPTTVQINNKTYAALSMFYKVFPYESGELKIPPIEISVETPNQGDYKGKKRTLKTTAKTVFIKELPANEPNTVFFVAPKVRVEEKWSKTGNTVLTGEILQRSISIKAENTLSQLLPDIIFDTIGGVSIYKNRAVSDTKKSRTAISSFKTQTVNYLFEKEGEIIIPQIIVKWFNPLSGKAYQRKLKERKFTVDTNPDMSLISSLKDSLNRINQQSEPSNTKDEEFNFLGLNLWQLSIGIIITMLIIYFIIKLLIRILKIIKSRKTIYKLSEEYHFKLFVKAIKTGRKSDILNSYYLWLLKFHIKSSADLMSQIENSNHKKEISKITNNQLQNLNIKTWKEIRKEMLYSRINKKDEIKINPY